jgi:hypothetical protein
MGPLSPQHGASSEGLQLWTVAANTLNKEPRTNDKGESSRLEVGRVVKIIYSKRLACYEQFTRTSDLGGFFG